MNLQLLKQQILSSDKTVAEKAQLFVNKKTAKQLTLAQWQTLVDEIPDEVEKAVAELLEPSGTGATL